MKTDASATAATKSQPQGPDSPLPRVFAGGVLRRLRTSDLAAFQAYRSLPELGRFQGWSPMPEAEATAFLADMHRAPLFVPGAWIQLGIAETDAGPLVGDVGLFLSADGDVAEVGFTLAPAAQGRGIATAAVREAMRILAEVSTARQVMGITDSRNVASIRVLERLGFRLRESREVTFRDEPCTERIYVRSLDGDRRAA